MAETEKKQKTPTAAKRLRNSIKSNIRNRARKSELKTVEKKIAELEKRSKELKEQLSTNHPKCLDKGFVIGYLK